MLLSSYRLNASTAISIDLTAREHDVLKLLDAGLSNEAIAGELTIAISTIKKHVHHIYQKLDIHSHGAASA